jgi:hypothetical protein
MFIVLTCRSCPAGAREAGAPKTPSPACLLEVRHTCKRVFVSLSQNVHTLFCDSQVFAQLRINRHKICALTSPQRQLILPLKARQPRSSGFAAVATGLADHPRFLAPPPHALRTSQSPPFCAERTAKRDTPCTWPATSCTANPLQVCARWRADLRCSLTARIAATTVHHLRDLTLAVSACLLHNCTALTTPARPCTHTDTPCARTPSQPPHSHLERRRDDATILRSRCAVLCSGHGSVDDPNSRDQYMAKGGQRQDSRRRHWRV